MRKSDIGILVVSGILAATLLGIYGTAYAASTFSTGAASNFHVAAGASGANENTDTAGSSGCSSFQVSSSKASSNTGSTEATCTN